MVFREIDRIRVKGKEEAIAIYEPLEKESAELESWGEALRAYRARQWVHDILRDPPPSDWDGITKFDEK